MRLKNGMEIIGLLLCGIILSTAPSVEESWMNMRRRNLMTISLPLYAWLLLLVGISALSGSIGALLACCVKVGKKPEEKK